MRILVLRTMPGIACVPAAGGPVVDPARTVTYVEGELYDMADSLADVFLREGWGREPHRPMTPALHPASERETKSASGLFTVGEHVGGGYYAILKAGQPYIPPSGAASRRGERPLRARLARAEALVEKLNAS